MFFPPLLSKPVAQRAQVITCQARGSPQTSLLGIFMLFIYIILEHSLGQPLEHKLHKFPKSKIKDLTSKHGHGPYFSSTGKAERYTPQMTLQTGDTGTLWEAASAPDLSPSKQKAICNWTGFTPRWVLSGLKFKVQGCGQKHLFSPNVTLVPIIEFNGKYSVNLAWVCKQSGIKQANKTPAWTTCTPN